MAPKLKTFPPLRHLPSGGMLHTRHRGVMYPPFMDLDIIERLEKTWAAAANDVFICTHQKVGTHLTKRFLVEILRHAQRDIPDCIYRSGDIGHGTVPWPEVMASQHGMDHFHHHLERTSGQARLWYTHTRIEHMPFQSVHAGARFIVVTRDPRAVAVSQYFFYRNHPLLDFPHHLSLDAYVELFLGGDLYFGDYFTHVRDWSAGGPPLGDPFQVLTISYEDLVQQKAQMVRKITAFLLPDFVLDDCEVAAIVAATEFDRMKADISQNPQSFHFNPETFFRAGTVRDWEQHLSRWAADAILERMRDAALPGLTDP